MSSLTNAILTAAILGVIVGIAIPVLIGFTNGLKKKKVRW